MHDWRYILCDLDGVEVGELWQAGERRFTRPLVGGGGGSTLAATLQLDNPMVDGLIGTTPAERLARMVKVYRDGELLSVMDVLTGEEHAEAGSETFPFSAAGPLLTRLNHRLLGRSANGYQDGTALAQKDIGQLMRNAVGDATIDGHHGVTFGALGASSNGYVEKLYFKKLAELLVELSQALGGPDFQLAPIEPAVFDGALCIATLEIAAVIGSSTPTAVFEYGTGKRNIRSYRRPIDAAGMMNVGYHLAPGFPDSVESGVVPVITGQNLETRAARRREDVVQADLQPAAMRQKLVDEHVRIRGYPRETIFITPIPESDVSYGTHYREGDLVEARAKVQGRTRFDAAFRIYNVEFTVDNQGVETAELALVNEAAQTL